MKKTLLTILQAGVTIGILFVLFRNPAKRHEMAETFRHSDLIWLLVGFGIYGVVEVFAGIRWQLLLGVQGIRLEWARMFMLLLIGVFFNYLIPGGTGGDVVKIFYLLKETPGKGTPALLSVLVDRLIGLLALILMSGVLVSMRWHWLMSTPETAKAVWPALIILGSAIAGVGFTVFVSGFGLVHKLPARMPGRDRIAEMALAYNLYARAWRPSLAALGLSVLSHIGYFAIFYCPALSFRAANVRIPTFAELCAIMPIVNTIASMPISVGGVGVREGLFQIFLGKLCGVTDAVAVMMSSTGYLLTLAWGLIGGVIYIFYRPSEHARLRDISVAVAGMEHTVAEQEIAIETARKGKH